MPYLRIRKIEIDVLPKGEPFISLSIDKIFEDENGKVIQEIGNFGRIYKRLSDIPLQPSDHICEDGYIDPMEMYTMIATAAYLWVMERFGGRMVGTRLMVD